MIVNTGMRTDIPAYYSKWLIRRIREKYVLVRNPYFPRQVTRFRLTPDVVDCLAFCTKNPQPMLGHLEELRNVHQFWFVTITPYGKEIEPHVPDKRVVIASLRTLSDALGRQAVSWRYDPVFLSEKYSVSFHIAAFEKMCEALCGYVDQCVISFIDLYEKTKRNFPGVCNVPESERLEIGREFARIGASYGIRIRSCCEGTHLCQFGIDVSGCMTREILEHAIGMEIRVPAGKKTQRDGCGCLLGSDIGAYNTCGHGCIYCYANENRELVRQNMREHDPESPLLIGRLRPEDEVRMAKQVRYCTGQMTLF